MSKGKGFGSSTRGFPFEDGITPPELIPDGQKIRELGRDGQLIQKVLALYEQGEISTLSEAAEKLGVSKYTLYKLKRSDPEFAEELDIAREIVADRLEAELLTCDKYPEAFARIFRLNGLRPEVYKDKKLTFSNPVLEGLLKSLNRASTPPQLKEGESA
jgi:hypothetical protein